MEKGAGAICLRMATPADADSVASVLSESFAEYKPLYTPGGYAATTPTAEQIRARWEEGPVWVAVSDVGGDVGGGVSDVGVVVGTVSAVLRGEELYVRSMAVVPSARGRRVGESLLARVEEFARAHGHARLTLTTTPFLSRAIRLYERAGFRPSSRGPLELFGTPLFEMSKDLRR
jgi:GNAT superfamily N-acetyltransferase